MRRSNEVWNGGESDEVDIEMAPFVDDGTESSDDSLDLSCHYERLMTSLQKNEEEFKFFLKIRYKRLDFDFVYPPPLNKTLLDVACCEGRVEPVKQLLRLDVNVNRLNDVHKYAPIHFAAEAGHADVLKLLLQDERCNPNLENEKKTTALHIAVGNDSIDCVRLLLDYCANPNVANSEGLTPIHIAAGQHNREVVKLILKISKFFPDLFDFQDGHKPTTRQILENEFPDLEISTAGLDEIEIYKMCDPMYKGNELDFLETLGRIPDYQLNVDMGMGLMCTAIELNFTNAARELLKKGRRVDGFLGMLDTSLKAVIHGRYRILREFFFIDAKLGRKLLFHACRVLAWTEDVSMDDRIECFKLILKQPNINIHCEDEAGNTPLYYAARANSIEAVSRLLKLGSYIGHKNDAAVPPLSCMSLCTWSRLFDNCIHAVDPVIHSLDAEDYTANEFKIEFDYRNLIPNVVPTREFDGVRIEPYRESENKNKKKISTSPEMETLAYIAENRSLQPLLNHPLLSSFLYLKWRKIWPILCANFVFYLTFHIVINFHILSTDYRIDLSSSLPSNTSNLTSTSRDTNFQPDASGALVAIFLILLAVRETFQLISSPGHYFSNVENILELVLIVLGVWTLVAPNPEVGAVVILLSAWELVILIGQHPRMSTGIEMLKIVTINFIKFLALYAILILAFALAFSTLFYNTEDNENFLDLGHWLFKTIIMLTGEFDANDIPFVSHPVLGRCIFVLFVFLIAIVMLNLLNGLAVSDTADILKKSEIVALISRVKLISYFEGVAVDSGLIKFAGRCFSESAIRRSMFNPPKFVGMRTLLFPKYLPERKIAVKPYKSNKIIVDKTRRMEKLNIMESDENMSCGACIEPFRSCFLFIQEIFCACSYLFGRYCDDWSMDASIVHRAREVLSRQKASVSAEKEKENENGKIVAEFDTMKAEFDMMKAKFDMMNEKFGSLKTVIYKLSHGNVRKSLVCRRPKASDRPKTARQPRVRPYRPQEDRESTV